MRWLKEYALKVATCGLMDAILVCAIRLDCTMMYCENSGKAYCKIPSPPRCSPNCAVWFDGCNTCKCHEGRAVMECTRRRCHSLRQHCIDPVEERCPEGCKTWFDGCNCGCQEPAACTMKFCPENGDSYCASWLS
eukprot:GHVO01020214.1.p1 GENE.GHVO01020214.1~~GHVO01020214.1.p1  ORF type:complete len:135 (-),score=1.90 GHVO01020214.1:80-484(-)